MKIGPADPANPDYLPSIRRAYDAGYIVVDTPTLTNWQRECPRGLDRLWLRDTVDATGLHLGERVLLHNDREWRVRFQIKVRGTIEPVTRTIDLSLEEWDAARATFAEALGAVA